MKQNNVFDWFRALSRVPRVSGEEKAISDWMVRAAHEMGLEVLQDSASNIIIRKGDGTPVILQGHLDMVGEKEADSPHDFHQDALDIIEEDGWLKADKTTLGADNGMALAMMLTLLHDEDAGLPTLELVMTTGEEVGLTGAHQLPEGKLKGNMLINLDAEEEGVFLTSCAGGETIRLRFTPKYERDAVPCTRITLGGLRGGHSGLEINSQRVNAIKALGELLHESQARLCRFEAPGKFNAICRQASAVIPTEDLDLLTRHAKDWLEKIRVLEKDARFTTEEAEASTPLTGESARKWTGLLHTWPDGVYTMSPDLEGLVESSSNLGLAEEENGAWLLTASLRSSSPEKMAELENKLRALAKEAGGEIQISGAYPGWAFEKESPLRDTAVQVWQRLFGQPPRITAIHAGLECGVIKSKYPHVQMLSLGPTLLDVHTPRERVEKASVERVYHFLRELLKELKG